MPETHEGLFPLSCPPFQVAQKLGGPVREQLCRSSFPHELTSILAQNPGRGGEDGLGLRAGRDEVEHGRMLTLPRAEYRH
jgi:hypothetical protein